MQKLHRGARLQKIVDELYLSRLASAIKHDLIMLYRRCLSPSFFAALATPDESAKNKYYSIPLRNKINKPVLVQEWFFSPDLNKNESVCS